MAQPIRKLDYTDPALRRAARSRAVDLSPLRLLVRCFVELKGDQWQGFSLEFGLAAQGDTLAETRRKLELMIEEYVREALTDDRAHAKALLKRKASWTVYAKFYLYRALSALQREGTGRAVFSEPLALEPRHCPA